VIERFESLDTERDDFAAANVGTFREREPLAGRKDFPKS
jgi:hypothetical protein